MYTNVKDIARFEDIVRPLPGKAYHVGLTLVVRRGEEEPLWFMPSGVTIDKSVADELREAYNDNKLFLYDEPRRTRRMSLGEMARQTG